MNVILYTRVSTAEQADQGYSLAHQKELLTQYCKINNHKIVGHFEEDHSAKDFNRPAFTKLMSYLKANKRTVDCVVFTKWDRFSRNHSESLRVIAVLKKMGIEVLSVEQNIDFTIPDNKLLLAIYLAIPEIENDKNSIRTKEGMRRAMKEGYWVGMAPFGYKNTRNNDKKPTLIIKENADLVRTAFKEMSKGVFSAEEIRKKFRPKGMTLCKQAFLNMLRNPVYIGKIYIPEWGKTESELVDGIHPSIISDELFYKVNEILSGRKPMKVKKNKQNDQLFLRGYLQCPVCNSKLTGSRSKGNGGTYFYYHCNCNYHRIRFRADQANEDFVLYLTSFRPPQTIINTYNEVLRGIAKEKGQEKAIRLKAIQSEIEKIERQLEKAEDRFVENDLDKGAYKRISDRYNAYILDLRREKVDLINTETKFEKHIKFGINLVTNLSDIFQRSPIEIKQKIIGLFFPEMLRYENGIYRTPKTNQVLKLFVQLSSLSEQPIKKQASISAGLSTQAPQAGLEPATL